MVVKAFILIEAEVGESGHVAEKVRKLDSVESVNMVIGPYDVVAVIEVATFEMVNGLVDKIHSVSGVCKTTTLLCVKP